MTFSPALFQSAPAAPAAPGVIRFFAPGTPKAQPRARATIRGKHAGVYDPGTSNGWKFEVALAARTHVPAVPLEGPVRADLTFYFKRPKDLCRKKDPAGPIWCPVKPDRDNAEKAVTDCLTTLGFWKDDAQVCAGEVRKLYTAKDGRTGCLIVITPLEGNPS